jgi:dimethylargininase
MFKNAIVRRPCPAMIDGITEANLGVPNYKFALLQHQAYVKVLEGCGLKVKTLEADNQFPDSTFIEDVSLCTPYCAIITNPGASSRKGEIAVMRVVLEEYYDNIEQIKGVGTLDAGDVMMVGSHYYVGLSNRTNMEGAQQLIHILERYGMTGSAVELQDVLHLKTGISSLENNNLLVSGEFIERVEFENFKKIVVLPPEEYAANSLWINGTILVPKGHSETKHKIAAAGYQVVEVDVSEFQKLDGGLSCLSLRF